MATTEQYSSNLTSNSDLLRLHLKQVRAREACHELILNQGEHSIGSDHRSDHVIEHPGIAPLHCTILVESDRATIKSFDKHTWLNEGPVKQAKLKAGDRLLIGPLEYEVKCSFYSPLQLPQESNKTESSTTPPTTQNIIQPVIDIHPLLHALSIAMERGKVPETARPLINEPAPLDIPTKNKSTDTSLEELSSLSQELKEAVQQTKEQLNQQRQQLDSLVVSNKIPSEQESSRIAKTLELNQQLEKRLAEIKIREDDLLKQQSDYEQKLSLIAVEHKQTQHSWNKQFKEFQDQQLALRLQEENLRQLTLNLHEERQLLATHEQSLNERNLSLQEKHESLLLQTQALADQQLDIYRLTENLAIQKDELQQAKAQLETLANPQQLLNSHDLDRLHELKQLESELLAREADLTQSQAELSRRQLQLDRRTATLLENEEALNAREAELLKDSQSSLLKRKELELQYQHRISELDRQDADFVAKSNTLLHKENELRTQAELLETQQRLLVNQQEKFHQDQNLQQLELSRIQSEINQQKAALTLQAQEQQLEMENLIINRQELENALQALSKREEEFANLQQQIQNKDLSLVCLEKELLAKQTEFATQLEELKFAQEDQNLVRRDLDQRLQDVTKREIDIAKLEQQIKIQNEALHSSQDEFQQQKIKLELQLEELKFAQEDQNLVRRDLDQRLQDITKREVDLAQLEKQLKNQNQALISAQADLDDQIRKLDTAQAEINSNMGHQLSARLEFDQRLQEIKNREVELSKLEQEIAAKNSELTAITASNFQVTELINTERAALALKLEELKTKENELHDREIEISTSLANLQMEVEQLKHLQTENSSLKAEYETKNALLSNQLQEFVQKQSLLQQQEQALASAQAELEENRAALQLQTSKSIEPNSIQFLPVYDSETPAELPKKQEQLELNIKYSELNEELVNIRGLLQNRESEFQELIQKYDQQQELLAKQQAETQQKEQSLIQEIDNLKQALNSSIKENPLTNLTVQASTDFTTQNVDLLPIPEELKTSSLTESYKLTDSFAVPLVNKSDVVSMSLDSTPQIEAQPSDSPPTDLSQENWSFLNSVFGANSNQETSEIEPFNPQVSTQLSETLEPVTISKSFIESTISTPSNDSFNVEINPVSEFTKNNISVDEPIPTYESPEELKARLFREELKSLFGMKSSETQEQATAFNHNSHTDHSASTQPEQDELQEEPSGFTNKWLEKFKDFDTENQTSVAATSSENNRLVDSPDFLTDNTNSDSNLDHDSDENHLPTDFNNQHSNLSVPGDEEVEEEEESVAKYMERLLARSRGWQSADSANPVEQKKSEPAKQDSSVKLSKPTLSNVTQNIPDTSPEDLQEPAVQVTRAPVNKEEVRKNLDEFRQVANKNARHAIARHSRKKMQNKMQIDIILIAVSTIVSLGLFSSPLWTTQSYYLYGMLAAGIGVFAAIEYMRTHFQLNTLSEASELKKEM